MNYIIDMIINKLLNFKATAVIIEVIIDKIFVDFYNFIINFTTFFTAKKFHRFPLSRTSISDGYY